MSLGSGSLRCRADVFTSDPIIQQVHSVVVRLGLMVFVLGFRVLGLGEGLAVPDS